MRNITLKLSVLFFVVFATNTEAQNWFSFDTALSGGPYLLNAKITGQGVMAIENYKGKLYAGGDFNKLYEQPSTGLAQWNGSKWVSVSMGLNLKYCEVHVLKVFNGELYAGGFFLESDNKTMVMLTKFDGQNWSVIATAKKRNGVFSLAVFKDELYAGGSFTAINGKKFKHIARLSEGQWMDVGKGTDGWVKCLCEHKGNLYAGGDFTKAGSIGANHIAAWDGIKWSAVGKGINNNVKWGEIWSLINYKDKLYAGGWFNKAGDASVKNIAVWNDSTWNTVGSGLEGGGVTTFTVFNDTIYAGGYMDNTINGKRFDYIALWDGTQWQPVFKGAKLLQISALYSDGAGIYIGGYGNFILPDGTHSNDIVKVNK